MEEEHGINGFGMFLVIIMINVNKLLIITKIENDLNNKMCNYQSKCLQKKQT